MADLASTCKDKLAYFRIKELKDILNQLGLPKQGKKQDLVERVLALLSDEQGQRYHGWGRRNSLTREAVAKVVDDTYRKMQVQCAPDLASRSHSGSDFSHLRLKEEANDYYHVETKVRCLCSSTMLNDNMIQCEDAKCQVWQHMTCVLIPDKPTEGASPEVPPHFYCELCRLNRADPFLVTTGNPLLPVKFMSSGVGNDGTSVSQSVEKTFQLSRSDRETVQRQEYELQVWCILINDKVQFRMQWPQYAELQVNGIPVRVVTRPGSQLLGINGRDDGPMGLFCLVHGSPTPLKWIPDRTGYKHVFHLFQVTTCSREGINKISLSRVDTRTFCFGVRIVRKRTMAQVLNLIPKEGEGESFVDALARVRRCLGGGGATDNADSDSDLEVVTESVTVSLRCPNSAARMKIAGRFKPCVHMGCFDLETFLELNQRSRKWQCPICLKNYSLENLMIDPYFNRITSLLRNCSEDVNELDVKPDGSWRVKGDAAPRELSQWHMPDGTLCDSKEGTSPGVENLNEVKREGTSDVSKSLKLGIKRNPNGIWQVKKPSMVGNHMQNNTGFPAPNTVPMISSPTGSYKDGEDASVNQEGGGIQFDISLNQEFDSFPPNFGQSYNTEDRQQQQQHNAADVIVLSDSDEENDTVVRQPVVYDNTATNGNTFPFTTNGGGSGYPERYQEDAGVGTSGLGILSSSAGDFEINNWQMHSYPPPEQGFQFFGTDTDVANPFVGSHNSFNIEPDDYSLDCNVGIEEPSAAHDISICRNSNEMHGSLVDNPLALAGDDPSLQILFPSQPSTVPLQEELSERANAPNGVHPDDWRISLTLAAGSGNEESTSVDGLKSQPKVPSKGAGVDPLTDAASALPSMNNDRSNGANLNLRSIENIFSHPRQPRSVRPRLCLSLDTDSE